ncbi:hypothetical protein Agub_g1176, partial [Astrephomene gubernaculifera]
RLSFLHSLTGFIHCCFHEQRSSPQRHRTMTTRRYVIVMRHAQRQDEVEDDWPGAEAARPGGRPWDPPLSSPCGLGQAEAAGANLLEWERRTGARIVSIVSSPFLRCLQTAAAACRHLGLPRMHLSWSLSETLCRLHEPPSGPLPSWMWPRPAPPAATRDGDGGGAGATASSPGGAATVETQAGERTSGEESGEGMKRGGAEASAAPAAAAGAPQGSCMTVEEFLQLLGAVVEGGDGAAGAAAGGKEGLVGAGVAEAGAESGRCRAEEEAARAAEDLEGEQKLPTGSLGHVLKGLRVSLLPPPTDPWVTNTSNNDGRPCSAAPGSSPAARDLSCTAAEEAQQYGDQPQLVDVRHHHQRKASRDSEASGDSGVSAAAPANAGETSHAHTAASTYGIPC